MNLQHLDQILGSQSPRPRINAETHIKHSAVRELLERAGYQTVGFVTGYAGSELNDADFVLAPDPSIMDRLQLRGALNEFEILVLHQTAIRILLDLDRAREVPITAFIQQRTMNRFDVQRAYILAIFDNLQFAPQLSGPKFVFAHILSPHQPYLFDAEGNPIASTGPFTLTQDESLNEETQRALYREQAMFVADKLAATVQVIIERSNRPVVIVIQADHGFAVGLDWEELEVDKLAARMAILNAYYLSEGCQDRLYPSITPVNTFRLILSCEVGMDMGLLEDTVYIGYESFTPMSDVIADLEGP